MLHGDVVTLDTQDCIVHSEARLTTLIGVKDMVVVSTQDAVLVMPRERAQAVKDLVARLKSANRAEATNHRRMHRPWGYYESIDMASARHPQSLLCYEMHGEPLTREHGAPLRMVLPIKLGYKQAKYVVALHVTRVLSGRRGYWEDQGYPWHGGL